MLRSGKSWGGWGMSSDVKVLPLGNCLEKIVDNRGKTPPLSDAETPFGLIEINAIVGQNKHPDFGVVRKYVSQDTYKTWFRSGHPIAGDVLFSTVGSIAEVSIICGGSGCIAQNLVALRANPDVVDPNYLYYSLINPETQNRLRSLDISSVQPSIKVPHLLATEIRILDIPQQKSVVAILGALDDRIALLRKTNTTLEAIAQALFKSWFVDFDPVHAKQQGSAPEGLDEATAALFPDGFEESALGLVPRGWRWVALDEAYEINPLRKLKKSEIASYLDMANVPTAGHCADTVVQREMGSGAKFHNGDTLLARITPCLENGKSAFVDFLQNDETGWGSTEFVVLRPRPPLPDYHAYLLCRHSAFREFAVQSMSGTSGRQRVQNDVLGRYLLALPTENVVSAFAAIVGTIQRRIAANHAQAQTLATLRDTLLPRLISGQLRLPEAEAAVEEAIA